jgi:hypothetical protein
LCEEIFFNYCVYQLTWILYVDQHGCVRKVL